MMRQQNSRIEASRRPGFTLLELLVVITIVALLLGMTVAAVNFTRDSERVVSAALQVQSFLSGARDRAIHAKEARGVRFFVDSTNSRAVTAMAYIDPAEYWSQGTIRLQRPDADNNNVADNPAITVVAGADTQWWQLKRRGLLFDGLRIRIPKGDAGTWYEIQTDMIDLTVAPPATQFLKLKTPYADPGDTPANRVVAFETVGPEDYELELAPRILPMDPVKLPADTIIDLDGSRLPSAWRPTTSLTTPNGSGNLQYSQFMDVVFSARGTVIGTSASGGIIQFYICDSQDSIFLKELYVDSLPNANGSTDTMSFTPNGQPLNVGKVLTFNSLLAGSRFIPGNELRTSNAPWLPNRPDDDPYLVRDRRIVSIFTQTGAVSASAVFNASPMNGFEPDPMYFAETGGTK